MPQSTIDEAAQILGVTTAEVWRRIRRGELTGHREGTAREARLVVDLPTAMVVAEDPREPSDLAQELRTDLALLVREMEAYRVEADVVAAEREALRRLLESMLADVQESRVTLPPLVSPTEPAVVDVSGVGAAVGEAPVVEPEETPPPVEDAATEDAATGAPTEATPAQELPTPTNIRAPEGAAAAASADGPPPDAAGTDAAAPDAPIADQTSAEGPADRPGGLRPPDSRYVVAGVRLHYLEWTPSQPAVAPPVILLHGISGNARNYDALTSALGDRFHLFALDLRGHGDSAWDDQRDYRISALVYDLNLFIDALGLPEVVLVGTGLGADVALGLVSARPGIVRGLVLNDSGPEAGSGGLQRVIRAIQDAPPDFDDIATAVSWWRAYYPALAGYDDAVVEDFIHSTLRASPDGRLIWKFDPALRSIDDLAALRDVDLSVAVGRIACPTLVVRGEHSDVLSRDAANRLRGRVRAASLLEAKGVAHAPSLVEDDVLPALETFLRSIGQEGPVAAS